MKKTITVIAIALNFFQFTNAQSTLNLKLFIEGFYCTTGLMDNSGAGGCLFLKGISTNLNDVDSVQISAMDATTFTEIESQKGILQTNGNISVTFTGLTNGNAYYLRISHRNTLQTWSSAPIVMNTVTAYDFTTAASKAFGNNMTEVTPGVFAIFSGDVNQDLHIDSVDYVLVDSAAYYTLVGYIPTDLSGDGVTESTDLGLITNNVYFHRQTISPLVNGIDNFNAAITSLIAYPNPGTGIFKIDIESKGFGSNQISVINSTGQIVYGKEFVARPEGYYTDEINLSGFESGLYQIQVLNNFGKRKIETICIVK